MLAVAAAAHALGTVLVVLAVLAMIMLHELGHFLAAKWADMKVTEFFVGFGRRLWSVRKGETEYGVKALVFVGGYCKIPGMTNLEDVEVVDEPRTYRQKSFPRRLSVAVAGSVMHFVIAFVLLYVLLVGVGIYSSNPSRRIAEISRLETGPSPAQEAGLRVGDEVEAIDGRPLAGWDELQQYIRAHPGQPVDLLVRRDDGDHRITVVPVDLGKVHVVGQNGPAITSPTGFVGIAPQIPVEHAGPVAGVGRAAHYFGNTVALTGGALKALFLSSEGVRSYANELLGHQPKVSDPSHPAPRLLSPVGLVRVAGQASGEGVRSVLWLLVSINIFVGIFNMVPLLPLDGGHVAIAIYEAVRSRRGKPYHADVAKLMPAFYLTLLVLGFLAVASLYLDIVRPLSLQ